MAIIRQGGPAFIAVHHTVPGDIGAKDLATLKVRAGIYDRYHKAKSIGWGCDTPGEFGYKYIRYHYLIARDGSFIQTQDEKYVLYHSGDGAKGNFNYKGIAIALDGNYEKEKPTQNQLNTLAHLIASFEKRNSVNVTVRAHKEIAKTLCAGKNVGTHDSGNLRDVIIKANDILTTPEKNWKEGLVRKDQKIKALDTAWLYNWETSSKIKEYKKGSEIGVSYENDQYYVTKYSFDNDTKSVFKKNEWEVANTQNDKIKDLELIIEAQDRAIEVLNKQKVEWEKEREELLRIKEQVKTFSISLGELQNVK